MVASNKWAYVVTLPDERDISKIETIINEVSGNPWVGKSSIVLKVPSV